MTEFLVVVGLNADRSPMAEGLRVETFKEKLAAEFPEHRFAFIMSPEADDELHVIPIVGSVGGPPVPISTSSHQHQSDFVGLRAQDLLRQSCASALS